MEPPAGVADLSTDVPRVWRAEGLTVVVPAERILHRPTKTRRMEAEVVLLVIYPAAGGDEEGPGDTNSFQNEADDGQEL